jgi:hypothetical protein
MDCEDLEVIAMTETLLIWDRIVNTPEINGDLIRVKEIAIEELHSDGVLFRGYYREGCPLCHYLRTCFKCPLLYNGHRCGEEGSMYNRVRNDTNKENAFAFFELLKKIEF